MPGSPATATGPSSSRRLVPLLRALINYPAGVARMPLGRFLLFSALGSLPWNAALLLAGYLLGENYERLYQAMRPYELIIYAVVLARRRLRHLPMGSAVAAAPRPMPTPRPSRTPVDAAGGPMRR